MNQKQTDQQYTRKVRMIQLQMRLVKRGLRNKSLLDKCCRIVMNLIIPDPPTPDYMQDDIISNDMGYDSEELRRYERGE